MFKSLVPSYVCKQIECQSKENEEILMPASNYCHP